MENLQPPSTDVDRFARESSTRVSLLRDDRPVDFISLDRETRTHVSTKVMCHHLGRREQTARGWACHEDGPIRPVRVNGRLAWPVAEIRRILGVA
jgi:hypothetical protein